MVRGIMVSEGNLDMVAEIFKRHCDELYPVAEKADKGKIKNLLSKVIIEVKDLRTRKKIERPEGSCTVTEASKANDVSKSTISGWLEKGYLAPVKTTSRRTFIREDEVAYLATIYKTAKGRGCKTLEQFFRQLAEN